MVSDSAANPDNAGSNAGAQGNGRERLDISSGQVLVIDQFMLGNEQFLSRVRGKNLQDAANEVRAAVQMYGGCVVDLDSGEYEVFRDPEQAVMAIQPVAEEPLSLEDLLEHKGTVSAADRVFVDTRCVVFVDAGILQDEQRLSTYKSFREQGDEKSARDFIRQNGGAVRYGFNRFGDELGVFRVPNTQVVAFWPDVVD